MQIIKECEQCHCSYSKPPSLAKRSRFCSKKCFDEHQSTSERKEITCKHCNKKFAAKQDHGVWPKYCSRKCFKANAVVPEMRECPSCSGKFMAGRSSHSEDRLRIYCSNKCRNEGLKNGRIKICINCEEEFYVHPSKDHNPNVATCCSAKCQHEYYILEKAPGWKGGAYMDNTSGMTRVLLKREGYVSPYIGEHRMVAAKSIGRLLERYEMVLHLNNIKTDNPPQNLFICGSNSEMRKRVGGTLPWPKSSNLDVYK